MSKILKILCKHQLYAKLSKCLFVKDKLHYLVYVVGKNGVKNEHARIEIVMRLITPHDVRKLWSFLGLFDYYKRFIQGYSTLVASLTNLLSMILSIIGRLNAKRHLTK